LLKENCAFVLIADQKFLLLNTQGKKIMDLKQDLPYHSSKTYKEQLRSLGLFRWRQLITAYSFLKGGSRGGGADLLSLVTSDRTQGNRMKLHQGKFGLDTRNRFFTERVVGGWNRLPGEVVTEPILSEFKEHLDNVLSLMV